MDLKMHSSSPTLYFIDEKTKSILEMACPKSHIQLIVRDHWQMKPLFLLIAHSMPDTSSLIFMSEIILRHQSSEKSTILSPSETVIHGSDILISAQLPPKSGFILLPCAVLCLSLGLEKCRGSQSPKRSNSGLELKPMPFQYSQFTYIG